VWISIQFSQLHKKSPRVSKHVSQMQLLVRRYCCSGSKQRNTVCRASGGKRMLYRRPQRSRARQFRSCRELASNMGADLSCCRFGIKPGSRMMTDTGARDACKFCRRQTEVISVRFRLRSAMLVMTCPNCALASAPDEQSSSLPMRPFNWPTFANLWQSFCLSGRLWVGRLTGGRFPVGGLRRIGAAD
jgi:hypothetical protein